MSDSDVPTEDYELRLQAFLSEYPELNLKGRVELFYIAKWWRVDGPSDAHTTSLLR